MKKKLDKVVVINQKESNDLWKFKKKKKCIFLDLFWAQDGAQENFFFFFFFSNSSSDSVENYWDKAGQSA